MDESTLVAFTAIWGIPASGSILVEAVDQLLDSAWTARPAWGIVPFEALDLRWKVLVVDGQSPIHNDFDPTLYPLKVSFELQPSVFEILSSNRDPDKLTTLIMTGVTALVRSTAGRMVSKGLTYPGEEVRDTFRAADLLHISNEVPFYESCPSPYPLQATLIFCSDPSYIKLLEDIGTDIVEMTGNHIQDYGSEATLFTLDMYDERGWVYFGGGRNEADAQKASLIVNNGNKLAFIGCNPVGPEFSWAGSDRPGAAQCDYEYMYSEITRLRGEGYLPIVTFQHYEYYSLYPPTSQIVDFQSMVDVGAVIVSGSQSHFPQYMEFYGGAYIHYGLGNLFFDQMDYPVVGTRREFADRHVFYDGRHISIELLTYLLEDYARPRTMLSWEREQFLLDVFRAGGLMK
jgi:poly-gamma-glutamate synthesis protein (capsule biosynthesis protein)